MSFAFCQRRPVWFALGLVAGLVLSALMPYAPLHAVATDRTQTFAMATGPVDTNVEAVYFLDFLTGDLRGVVLGRQGNMFTAFYQYNVLNDLGVNPARNPNFMLATGLADLRRGAGLQPSQAVIYVAEVTTGVVAAYAVPWNPAAFAANRAMGPSPFIPLAVTRFRAANPAAAAGGGEPAAPGGR